MSCCITCYNTGGNPSLLHPSSFIHWQLVPQDMQHLQCKDLNVNLSNQKYSLKLHIVWQSINQMNQPNTIVDPSLVYCLVEHSDHFVFYAVSLSIKYQVIGFYWGFFASNASPGW